MKRKQFIKKSLLGLAAAGTPAALKANATNKKTSTYDRLMERVVGFNHLPNQKEERTMNTVLHKAATRGHANHGWLDTHHTFSFANYYNPERMHFGVLRVLNDDIVDGGRGFGRHPHDNMEIISIPLAGDLEHKDSMGNTAIIRQHDIQIMSAGTGVFHSEYNKHKDQQVNFLQIWVFPKQKNIEPRYDQISFKPEDRINKLQQIVSPNAEDEGVQINQDAWFHLGNLKEGFSTQHQLQQPGNGIYAFVIDGKVSINGQDLERRDGFGLWNLSRLDIKADSDAELLLMEVPMQLNK